VTDPIRVVVWSTGGVGSVAIDAIRCRPDLELVGVWVHSPDKEGKDAGELGGGDPIGWPATNDADALIALKPDCVVYAASGPQRDAGAVPDYLKLLRAGINVVSTSTTGLIYPRRTSLSNGVTNSRPPPKAAGRRSTRREFSPGLHPISSHS
jgi:2,4-diaminopentanoate dehydrogenase